MCIPWDIVNVLDDFGLRYGVKEETYVELAPAA